MFDFRYHALSLVAVFMALVIGILLGIAIGDKGLVSGTRKDLINSLRRDVGNAPQEAEPVKAHGGERREGCGPVQGAACRARQPRALPLPARGPGAPDRPARRAAGARKAVGP